MCDKMIPPLVNLLSGVVEADGDPVHVHHAQVRAAGDIALFIEHSWQVFSHARTVVIDARTIGPNRDDISAIYRTASIGVRVAVVGAAPLAGIPPLMVHYDPAWGRTVVAAVYALPPRQSVIVVSPEASTDLSPHIRHALRWRASWQEVEEGDFSPLPRA